MIKLVVALLTSAVMYQGGDLVLKERSQDKERLQKRVERIEKRQQRKLQRWNKIEKQLKRDDRRLRRLNKKINN